jgi:gamma-glutamyltranspeptidase
MFMVDGTMVAVPRTAVTGLSIGVPGVVRMLEAVHRRHGKRLWSDLFAPAIKLAEDGFAVSPGPAYWLAREALGHDVVIVPHNILLRGLRARYGDDGRFIGYEGGSDPRISGKALG